MGTDRRAGRNFRRQHPYASHKHTQKDSTKGCQQARKEHIQRTSLQRTNVQHSAKQEPPSHDTNRRQGQSDKAKKNARSNILRVPVRRRGGPSLDEWDTQGDIHKLPFMENLREELRMHMWSIYTRYNLSLIHI